MKQVGAHCVCGGGLAVEAAVTKTGRRCTVHAGHPEIGAPSIETDVDGLPWCPNLYLAI